MVQGVKDPLGGIEFVVAAVRHRQSAATATVGSGGVATTIIIIKVHRAKYSLVTLLPLAWLVTVTQAHRVVAQKCSIPTRASSFWRKPACSGQGPATSATRQLIFNNRLDAAVTATFW